MTKPDRGNQAITAPILSAEFCASPPNSYLYPLGQLSDSLSNQGVNS